MVDEDIEALHVLLDNENENHMVNNESYKNSKNNICFPDNLLRRIKQIKKDRYNTNTLKICDWLIGVILVSCIGATIIIIITNN